MDGLTLDVDDDLLYWTDVTYQNIQRADLNGGNRRTILKSLDKPRAIVLYKTSRFAKSPACLLERNRPFAGSGRMVQNKLHWDANDAVGLPKQRNSYQFSPTFLYFESPTASFASQCNLFRTM